MLPPQFGKVVSRNFTVGGKSYTYTLPERNAFLEVGSVGSWNSTVGGRSTGSAAASQPPPSLSRGLSPLRIIVAATRCDTLPAPHPPLHLQAAYADINKMLQGQSGLKGALWGSSSAYRVSAPSLHLLPPRCPAVPAPIRCLTSAFLPPTHPPGYAGALFWQWFNDGQEAGVTEGGGRGLYGERDAWAGGAGRLGWGWGAGRSGGSSRHDVAAAVAGAVVYSADMAWRLLVRLPACRLSAQCTAP